MKKFVITLILSIVTLNSFSQQMSYSDWQAKAKEHINLQPEYGNVKKTDEQLADDRVFIETVLKEDTTLRKGSEHLVHLGFNYLTKGDLETAMKRFNQAWLLDPKTENAYWGIGAVYGYFGDYKTAIVQYDKGLLINPNSSVILTDKATLYFVQFQHDHDQIKLNTAIDLLKKSYAVNPRGVNTTYKLSVCYFLNKDCTNAWKFYDECEKLGGGPIAPNYTSALKNLCPK